MANSKIRTDAIGQNSALGRIAPGATNTVPVELDNVLNALNSEVTPLLELKPSATPNLVVSVGALSATNPETGAKRVIPPISNLLPVFTGGTITFPSASGGSATPSAGTAIVITISVGNFLKVGISLTAAGNLVLQSGAQGATEALATAPALVPNSFAIGYVVLQNVAGTIQPITAARIYQYVGGGAGGSGSGNASTIRTALEDTLQDSIFELVTPIDFAIDGASFVGGSSTGAYSLVTGNFEMGSGQTFYSTNLFDPSEFYTAPTIPRTMDLVVYWAPGFVDTAAAYAVSRDGTNYQNITMTRIGNGTNAYQGSITFSDETVITFMSSNDAAQTTQFELNASSQLVLSSAAVVVSPGIVRDVRLLDLVKTGSPQGTLIVDLCLDNAGSPGAVISTGYLAMSSVVSGATTTVDIADVAIAAGTYHVVVKTDAAYKASFVTNATSLKLSQNGTGLRRNVVGINFLLSVRVTSSAANKALAGLGIFYKEESRINGGTKKVDAKVFTDSSIPATFELSFIPDVDLLKVYHVETGQVYRSPAFSVQGTTITFPTGTFTGAGSSITLIFDQIEGSSFDNSDQNAALLTANRLGSTNGAIDRSVAGRGILLRKPNTVFGEITLDNNNNLGIYNTAGVLQKNVGGSQLGVVIPYPNLGYTQQVFTAAAVTVGAGVEAQQIELQPGKYSVKGHGIFDWIIGSATTGTVTLVALELSTTSVTMIDNESQDMGAVYIGFAGARRNTGELIVNVPVGSTAIIRLNATTTTVAGTSPSSYRIYNRTITATLIG